MKTTILYLKKTMYIYCLLILFFFNSNLHAQIIYTDIQDATPNATYPLDLNNDGIDDFIIHYVGGVGTIGVMCSPQNNNAYAGNFVNGEYLPWALSTSNFICDTLSSWHGANHPGLMGLGTNIGYWPGVNNKYLALKLIVGTNTYYGWARLDVFPISSSFTIKDYAYESNPNACIQAGKNSLGNNGNSIKKITVFPNPFFSSTTINIADNLNNATLIVYNAYGQPIKQVRNITGKTVPISRDNLPCGLYFMRITEENKLIGVEKLIIAY